MLCVVGEAHISFATFLHSMHKSNKKKTSLPRCVMVVSVSLGGGEGLGGELGWEEVGLKFAPEERAYFFVVAALKLPRLVFISKKIRNFRI